MFARLLPVCAMAALLAAGCQASGPMSPAGMAPDRALHVRARFDGYGLQAVVKRYTPTDVKHLVLQLFTVSGSTETAVMAGGDPVQTDLVPADFTDVIRFGNLKPNTTYRVKAFAYKELTTNATDLISTADSGSYADLVVAENDAPTFATTPSTPADLKVKLIDTPFSAEATSTGITITPGAYGHAPNEAFVP